MDELPPLWAHQSGAIGLAERLPDMALFMDVGTGKSRTIVEILRMHLNRNKRHLKTLIICPSAVIPNWRRELLKFSQIQDDKIHLLDDKMNLAKRAEKYVSGNPGIYITNFEAFAFPQFAVPVATMPPEILIVDESHRVKSFDAKRTKAIVKLSHNMQKLPIHHRYILSGSPVTNDHLDIFTQFQILDAGATFGTNFYAFRASYFTAFVRKINAQKQFTEWAPKPGIEERLKALMSAKTVVAKKEECLDLPPFIRVEIDVELSSEQKKVHEQMKKDFIAFIDEKGASIAQIALTKMLRLQQIISGFLPVEKTQLGEATVHRFEKNPRAKVLADLLEDLTRSEKVIVWSVFHEDFETIRQVCSKLCIEYAEVTGLIRNKQEQLDKFDNDPNCRVMISSQAAGGTGINMIEASSMIYYSKGFNFEHDLQSEARNYRGGSEKHKKITRYDLVARKTIDEVILKALREKKDLSTNILALRDALSII